MLRAVLELTCENCGYVEWRPLEALPKYTQDNGKVKVTMDIDDPRAYLKRVGWWCAEEPQFLVGGEVFWSIRCSACGEPTLETPASAKNFRKTKGD